MHLSRIFTAAAGMYGDLSRGNTLGATQSLVEAAPTLIATALGIQTPAQLQQQRRRGGYGL